MWRMQADLPNLTVAVKKLDPKSKAVDEIASEVYAKKALDMKHDNVVTLLASYSKRHLHLLIYEYMKHGSLGPVLFGIFFFISVSIPALITMLLLLCS